jgi:hypothetical protein
MATATISEKTIKILLSSRGTRFVRGIVRFYLSVSLCGSKKLFRWADSSIQSFRFIFRTTKVFWHTLCVTELFSPICLGHPNGRPVKPGVSACTSLSNSLRPVESNPLNVFCVTELYFAMLDATPLRPEVLS